MFDHQLATELCRDGVTSRNFNYTYIPIGKAANTNIKRWLWQAEHELGKARPVPEEYHAVHRASWVLSEDEACPWKGFGRARISDFFEAIASSYVFTVVRNPFYRLLSGYENKIETKGAKAFERFWLPSRPESFSEFVSMIADTHYSELNPHFRPQWYSAGIDFLPVQKYCRLELSKVELAEISNMIFGKDMTHLVQTAAPHARKVSDRVAARYSDRDAEKVYAYFKRDFEDFGYSSDIMSEAPVSAVTVSGVRRADAKAIVDMVSAYADRPKKKISVKPGIENALIQFMESLQLSREDTAEYWLAPYAAGLAQHAGLFSVEDAVSTVQHAYPHLQGRTREAANETLKWCGHPELA